MQKLGIRAAVLALFTTILTAVIGIASSGTAMACSPQSNRSDELAASLPQVNPGDTGSIVVALQLALRTEGYGLQGTGTYANVTLNAVRDFQQKHGINNSGIVGSKTWHALVGPKSKMSTKNGEAVPPAFGINPGESNAEKMSYLNNTLIRIYPYYDQVEYNSTYDEQTQSLVRDFQRRAGINPSGIVGPKTWTAMYLVISVSGQWGC
jgi:peptidoglycan hydrolase-like protein with peptidoglycan-binding domain